MKSGDALDDFRWVTDMSVFLTFNQILDILVIFQIQVFRNVCGINIMFFITVLNRFRMLSCL